MIKKSPFSSIAEQLRTIGMAPTTTIFDWKTVAVTTELEFLNVSWGRKTGVDLSLPLFFSMYIKCGIFEQTKTGVVGYLVTSQKLKF